jgi:dephospho-CoA kinase
MMETRGYSYHQALARISAQMSVEEKSRRAHYTVYNNSTCEDLYAEAVKLVDWLQERLDYGRNNQSSPSGNKG